METHTTPSGTKITFHGNPETSNVALTINLSLCYGLHPGNRMLRGTKFYTQDSIVELYRKSYQHCVKAHVFYYETEPTCFFRDRPWQQHVWFRNAIDIWAPHLPITSETVPGAIAYYQSAEKRARNIRTPIKPGRYLSKYFSGILTQEQIQQYAIEFSEQHEPAELRVTQDADEIETIYRNGPGSCMKFEHGGYAGDEHPACVYAGPDLGVAYIGAIDDAAARAVVWPEKKIYSRIYGDEHRMQIALQKEGFAPGSLRDARVQKIPYECGFIMPYVDNIGRASEIGDYIVLDGGGPISTQYTTGLSFDDDDSIECTDCGHRTDIDDAYGVEGERDVCESCFSNSYVNCEISDYYIHTDNAIELGDGDGFVHRDYLDRYGSVFRCEHDGLVYMDRYLATDAHGVPYHKDNITKACTRCDYSKTWYPHAETVELDSGRHMAQEWYDQRDSEPLVANFLDDDSIRTPTIPHPNQLEMPIAAGA